MLEIPLQPLFDNLDSYTYEVFETDPVKYKFYQDAVQQLLLDRVSEEEAKRKLVSKENLPQTKFLLNYIYFFHRLSLWFLEVGVVH